MLQTRRTGRKISHLIFTIKTQQTKPAPNMQAKEQGIGSTINIPQATSRLRYCNRPVTCGVVDSTKAIIFPIHYPTLANKTARYTNNEQYH